MQWGRRVVISAFGVFIDLFIFSLFDILNQASKNEGKTDLDSDLCFSVLYLRVPLLVSNLPISLSYFGF